VFIFITVLYNLFASLQSTWTNMLYLSIVLTITVGNLFAMRQNNLKRFLAFSSIAQVGYILLGISSGSALGISSAIFFLLVYTFSNLGAFGVIAVVSAHTGKEAISDYKGFYATNPWLSWVFTICLFSLAGIPPTAGFFGKMFLLTAGAAKGNWALIIIAAMNMVISLYYYLRVVRAIFMEKNEQPIAPVKGSNTLKLALAICVVGVVVLGFAGNLFQHINTIIAK
jgi:NADH-quinone oxidoreductase subunit N